jgi:hypothetical protein
MNEKFVPVDVPVVAPVVAPGYILTMGNGPLYHSRPAELGTVLPLWGAAQLHRGENALFLALCADAGDRRPGRSASKSQTA